MKYPDINIQIKYPNKLINADTPLEGDFLRQLLVSLATKEHGEICLPIELCRKLY